MRMVRYYLPAMGWIILILFLCTLPGKAIPTSGFLEMLHFDKVVHFFLFGGMVLLLAYGYYRHHGRIGAGMLTLIVTCVSAYGLAIEFIQKYLVANRSFDLWDFAADTAGAIAGALIFRFVGMRFLK
ncbi:VanZ family protein [Chitinophaga caseinilytica]|uniref:VanZ family protein n=1 Tax=Chitinophaga caseinilytica TaxID=2267521 RepID=A0ABZ2Z5Q2_9BACT